MLEQLKDRIIYSYYLEKLDSNLCSRINLILSAIIIVLGASIFAQIFNNVIIGVLIALTSGIQITLKLGEKSENSRLQALNYSKLITLIEFNSIDENEVLIKFNEIESNDKFRLSSLESSAMLLTKKHLDIEIDNDSKFSVLDKLIIFIAGGKFS